MPRAATINLKIKCIGSPWPFPTTTLAKGPSKLHFYDRWDL